MPGRSSRSTSRSRSSALRSSIAPPASGSRVTPTATATRGPAPRSTSVPTAACTISAVRNEPGTSISTIASPAAGEPPLSPRDPRRRAEGRLGQPATYRSGVPVSRAAVAHAPRRRRHRAVAALLEDAQEAEPVHRAVVGGDDEVAPGRADDDRLRIGQDQLPAQLGDGRRRADRVVGRGRFGQGRGQQDPPPDRRVGDPAVRPSHGLRAATTRLTPGSRRSGSTRSSATAERRPAFEDRVHRLHLTLGLAALASPRPDDGPQQHVPRPQVDHLEAGPGDERGELVALVAAEVAQRHVVAAPQLHAARDGDQHPPAGAQHPSGLARDGPVVLDVLPDVGRHDEVEGGVGEREAGWHRPGPRRDRARRRSRHPRGSTPAPSPTSRGPGGQPCCRRPRSRRPAPGRAATRPRHVAPSPAARRTTSAAPRAPPTWRSPGRPRRDSSGVTEGASDALWGERDRPFNQIR